MKQKNISKQAVPCNRDDRTAPIQYIFGRNITKGSKTDTTDWEKYRIAELPETLSDNLEKAEEAEQRAVRRGKLPTALSVVKYICLFVGVVCASGILGAKVSFAQAYRNAPHFFWIAGVCLLAGGLLWLIGRSREKHLNEKKSIQAARKAMREAENGADAYLSVPKDAKEADVLLVEYSVNNGKPVCKGPAELVALRLYCRDNALCLADRKAVYAIGQSKLNAIRLVERTTALLNWNKEDDPSQSKYQKSGLFVKRQTLGLGFYCALEWADDNERWQLLFPAYELPKFTALTGLPAPKLPAFRQTKKSSVQTDEQDDEKVRPRFYWTVPKEENAGFWFTPLADESFKADHPRLYGLLVFIGIFLLILPMAAFLAAAITQLPDKNSPWLLLGTAGGFAAGIGLFNIVAAWLHQYLGHWVTIISIGLGAAMMAASWLLLQ